MKLTRITVSAQRLNRNTACWEATLEMQSLHTSFSGSLTRPLASDVTVTAELAAIWTALQQIKGFHWIEINASPSAAAVLSRFLRYELPAGYETAYRHFERFFNRHRFLIGGSERPSTYFVPMVSRILELNPELRSRALRAAQLVTIGAVSRHPVSGFQCWSKTHPLHPYRIHRDKTGEWSCTCPDDSRLKLTDSQPVCKHLLAVMMTRHASVARRLRQCASFSLHTTS